MQYVCPSLLFELVVLLQLLQTFWYLLRHRVCAACHQNRLAMQRLQI
jgi:hypothetical protein